jgi:CubicO group peptidase (beta-lactamase class C family)
MHTDFMRDVNEQQGTLTFHSSRDYQQPLPQSEMVAIVKTARTEQWQALSVYITAEPPYLISGLRMSSAHPPSNLPRRELTLPQALTELDAYVKRMAEKDVFSGTVLLAQGDKVLYKAAHGLASKRFNVPNNLQTRFNLGSMNKMFTATATLQLVEKGKLKLTDKLSQFVDNNWLASDVSDKIEIRHLLSHTSGLGSYFNQTYMDTSKSKFRTLDDYKPLIKDETLRFEPGSRFGYSNTGMLMLGVVIEKVSGMDYFEYIHEHIYQPAGMNHSDSYAMDQPVVNLAIGYERDRANATGWRNNLYQHVLKGGPAGGGFSTVEDLHRFATALTNYKLLSKSLTETLYSAKPQLNSPSYGYGFSVRGAPDNRVVGHGGGFDGISSNLDIYLDQGYVIAVMSNYSSGARPVEGKIRELLALLE